MSSPVSAKNRHEPNLLRRCLDGKSIKRFRERLEETDEYDSHSIWIIGTENSKNAMPASRNSFDMMIWREINYHAPIKQ
jgi:hypothetical protein